MSKVKRELNPKVSVGDKVMCLNMDGESSVPPMTTGIVRNVVRDPFEVDGELITVNWDNGSTLALVSITDSWVKVPNEQKIEEQTGSPEFNYERSYAINYK